MKSARIVFKRDVARTVTLNGECVGVVSALWPGSIARCWKFTPANPMGPLGLEFQSYDLSGVRFELYRRLAAPLSGR